MSRMEKKFVEYSRKREKLMVKYKQDTNNSSETAGKEQTQMRTRWKHLLAAFLVLAVCLTGCNTQDMASITAQASGTQNAAENVNSTEENREGTLTVTYLDVGQGNAILAESEGHYMFIDGGARESSSFVVSYLKKQNIEKFDYLLISHFDEDHLAGAIGLLHNFPVEKLLTPDYTADTSIYRSYEEVTGEKAYNAVHPVQGEEFKFGSAAFKVVSPVSYGHEDGNQDSIGIIMQNGGNKFFIGGDIGLQGEKEILASGADLDADVMLMNHHGSHVSRNFLEAVSPSFAVISCGADNSYGHPRKDTAELLKEKGIPLFRTDKQGTIVAHSNGKEITFEQKSCNDYTPGMRGQGSDKEEPADIISNSSESECDYILNTHTKKIHKPECSSAAKTDEDNKAYFKGSKEELLENGYSPCGNCKP